MKRIKVINLKMETDYTIPYNHKKINSSYEVIELIKPLVDGSEKEMYIICGMDKLNAPIFVSYICFSEEFNYNVIREILKTSLVANCRNLIVIEYSLLKNVYKDTDYYRNFDNMKKSSDLVGLNFIDFIKIGYDFSYCSMYDNIKKN